MEFDDTCKGWSNQGTFQVLLFYSQIRPDTRFNISLRVTNLEFNV